jgi:hypothetical protein
MTDDALREKKWWKCSRCPAKYTYEADLIEHQEECVAPLPDDALRERAGYAAFIEYAVRCMGCGWPLVLLEKRSMNIKVFVE